MDGGVGEMTLPFIWGGCRDHRVATPLSAKVHSPGGSLSKEGVPLVTTSSIQSLPKSLNFRS